eukprot:TRINITY_DN2611_c0_g1_i6.p2 TRINITY_DN2611_c0_g1~~TRINITY_DN2611_c0_g1_i6.p2  ORF type:complete len:316 (+),score=36.60 TRINITY_DN2611_c0_g1_i6:87-1034(+)
MTKYCVRVRLVEIYGSEIGLEIDRAQNNFDVHVELQSNMKLQEVAKTINLSIEQETRDQYEVMAFCVDDYDFEVQGARDERFKRYELLIDEENGIQLEAFAVNNCSRKGVSRPFFQFEDIENEDAAQRVAKQNAVGVLQHMKDGLAFQTDCQNCHKQGLYQVKFGRCNTVSFDLRRKIECAECKSEVSPISPCFMNCEFRAAGQTVNSIRATKTRWKTAARENDIYFFFRDEEEHNKYQNVVDWSELIIYVKQLNNNRCKACKQVFGCQEEGKNEECAHKYHDQCFRSLKPRHCTTARCAVPGCRQELTNWIPAE